jgi:pyruvate,water dikinase
MSDATDVLPIRAGAPLPAAAGGKAHGLLLILEAGLPIPEAWAVLPGTGEESIAALAQELEEKGIDSLAVRSSAVGEDAGGASFAGIHESLLGIAPADLTGAVRDVAASALSDRAAAYRREMGLSPAEGPAAVVVQPLVPADRAGVAFGIGEANDAVVVEAVPGLGEALVQGKETPETWEATHTGGSWNVFLRGKPPGGEPVLSEEAVGRIADGVRRLQSAAGVPLDVEWCSAGGSVSYVQARPRTRPLGALPAGQAWTRSNFRDVLPDVATALTRSFVRNALGPALREYYATFLRLDDGTPLIESIYGRLVSNESVLQRLLDLLGVPRSIVDVSVGGGEGGADRFEPMDLWRQARHPILMMRSLANVLRAPRRSRRFLDRLGRLVEEARALSPSQLSDADLTHWVGTVPRETGTEFARCSVYVVGALQGQQYRLASLLRAVPHPGAAITRLVAPVLDTVSTRLTDELTELAIAFRRWEGGARFLSDLTDEHRGPSAWRESLPPDLFERVRSWVDRHGHRGPWESDLASTRYRDDWRIFGRLLLPLVAADADPESPDARRARLEAARDETWREVAARVGPLKRMAIRGSLRQLAKLLALREELRSETVASFVRPVFREAGRRLAEREQLASWEDLWHLTLDELVRALTDPGFDAAGAVARERGRRAAWKRIDVPNRFRSEEVPEFRYRPHEGGYPSVALTGTGISPGLAVGRCRLLTTPEDGVALEAGEILVAHTTDPGWTPLFARAGGVVVEMGGTLSHAGIVAREYGIPCVGNVEGVMHRLLDGQTLRIDGTKGEVEVTT